MFQFHIMEMFSTTVLLHYVVFIIAIVPTTATIPTTCDTCDSRWYKIYENDDKGNAINGSLDDLALVLSKSDPIRFLIPSWGTEGYIGDTDLYFSDGDSICSVSRTHMSNNVSNTFADDLYLRFFFVCSSGLYSEQYYKVDTNEWIQANDSTKGIQWFTKKSSCRMQLSPSNFTEEAIKESKIALTNSVLKGHDITISVDHFILELYATEITTDENVLGHKTIFPEPEAFLHHYQHVWYFADISAQQFRNSLYLFTILYPLQKETGIFPTKWLADTCWRHVYTHDENGTEQDGTLSELVSAVQSGHRVKIVMGNYSTEANNVMTKSGHVSVQLLNRIYQNLNNPGGRQVIRVLQRARTTGTVDTRNVLFVNGTSVDVTTEKKTISWFVDTRPWTKILSTNKNGDVTFGSEVELKKAIQNGAQVRVAVQVDYDSRNGSSHVCVEKGWLLFKAEGLQLGPSGEVSAELGESVSTEEDGSGEVKVIYEPFRIVTTQGNVDISQIRAGKDTNEGHFSVKQAINWFVNY